MLVWDSLVIIGQTEAKCNQLVQLAKKHDVLVVVDDVYNLLWFQPCEPPSKPLQPPARLLTFDKASDPDYGRSHVISVGTFSKFLAPGIRLGWLEASEKILSRLYTSGLAVAGGSFNHYMSRVVSVALKSGQITQHVDAVRQELKKRMDKLCDVLEKHLPNGCSFVKPE
ncbi:2-aminoadipate transaminase, partial [Elysia marginata]